MKLKEQIKQMIVKPGKKVSLKDFPTRCMSENVSKDKAKDFLDKGAERLQQIQDKLYSNGEYSILIVIQAMDAAGKDSLVKHVLGNLNPTGVKVHAYKAPSELEKKHDYLWRHNLDLPRRGEISIFIRSHYENVLATRVHPEYVVAERIPGIDDVEKVNKQFFKTRFRQVNDWERHLAENGTRVIKIFLHSSKDEQKRQFLERIEDEAKNWKFSMGDLAERKLWDKYMDAYNDMLSHTSTPWAPWYVVPADDRWFAHMAAGAIIYKHFEKLKIDYPTVSQKQMEELEMAKQQLLSEQ